METQKISINDNNSYIDVESQSNITNDNKQASNLIRKHFKHLVITDVWFVVTLTFALLYFTSLVIVTSMKIAWMSKYVTETCVIADNVPSINENMCNNYVDSTDLLLFLTIQNDKYNDLQFHVVKDDYVCNYNNYEIDSQIPCLVDYDNSKINNIDLNVEKNKLPISTIVSFIVFLIGVVAQIMLIYWQIEISISSNTDI